MTIDSDNAPASAETSPRRAFRQGMVAGLPFSIVVVPFGMVFGVIATEAGLNLAETMGFSILVIAGASQLAAVQLMVENAPTVVVVLTALAVNLRMAMYSAALAPHLGAAPVWQRGLIAYLMVDQAYTIAHLRYETGPPMTMGARVAYYFGVVTPICPLWYLATLFGAIAGTALPPGLPIDVAVPIAFLAMIAPMLRTLAHVSAAFISVAGALAFAFVPYNLGLLLAAALAMAAGAWVELWTKRRRGKARP
ncbi:MAG: AzlC family ABC transporter permease [Pararhodobacter sp.]|nr:AzlC family ABC transporter permease [Pararhodobacter sp.]